MIPEAQEAGDQERRREQRVPLDDASLEIGGGGRGLVLASAVQQYEVHDLSLSGLGLRAEGQVDKALLCGFRKPTLKAGDVLEVRLQIGGLFRPLDVKAKVVRIDQVGKRNDFRVGICFHELDDSQRSELKKLCSRQLGSQGLPPALG